jgi:hypothetical protein
VEVLERYDSGQSLKGGCRNPNPVVKVAKGIVLKII